MKAFTRALALVLALAVLLCFAACGRQEAAPEPTAKAEPTAAPEPVGTAGPAATAEPDSPEVTSEPEPAARLETQVEFDMTSAYLDYAKRLEESGNDAAAALVYARLEQAAAADARNAVRKTAEENSVYRAFLKLLEVKRELEFWGEVSGK